MFSIEWLSQASFFPHHSDSDSLTPWCNHVTHLPRYLDYSPTMQHVLTQLFSPAQSQLCPASPRRLVPWSGTGRLGSSPWLRWLVSSYCLSSWRSFYDARVAIERCMCVNATHCRRAQKCVLDPRLWRVCIQRQAEKVEALRYVCLTVFCFMQCL